eukprot:TRINITY_DN2779_c0_g1_i1.p1 TRINITY_DN2779_c0_g1~~TRINITY_DN2779_c0_g1_i1.p1  ORF type:complete len:173 (-),score=32.88 TRINITY_DN2779_c0_g1_i1:169-687(-)
MFDDAKENSPLNMYYFTNDLDKGQQTFKTKVKHPHCFGYAGTKTKPNTYGAPVFCGKSIVGVHHGETRSLGKKECSPDINEAISIKSISDWIEKKRVQTFSKGEDVLATWTDGYRYPAKILYKTERGFKVRYPDYDTEEDLEVHKIHKNSVQPYTTTTKIKVSAGLKIPSKI